MQHPSSALPDKIIGHIREYTAAAEQKGQLTTEQLEIIYRQRWFHLFVPEQYGGLNLSLPEAVRLEEGIAYADGSVGWVVTLCAGAAMFIGFFDEALAKEVFTHPHVCIAGSGQPTGAAKIIDGGFEVTGNWRYSSGAPHATHLTANCIIEKDGERLLKPDGSPLIQSFIFKKEETTLYPNWNYIGLNATAGHSYSVEKLKIPANRTFIIDAAHAKLAQPVYHYPFLQLAETTIAANISGMCYYFLDLAKQLISEKENTLSGLEEVKTKELQLLAKAVNEINLLRGHFFSALDDSWQTQVTFNNIPADKLRAVSEASVALAQQSRNWANQIYPYCGLKAARTDTIINQVWRNINTASQHSLLNRV